jgi:hypothetical protein
VLTGSAVAAGFRSFKVEWAAGTNPSGGWKTAGVSLYGSQGNSPVSSGPLAAWDTSSIVVAGYYTIRLSVTGAGYTDTATAWVYLEPALLSAEWPKFFDMSPPLEAGVVPVRNSDGSARMAMSSPGAGSTPGALWSFNISGAPQKTILPSGCCGSYGQPAAANVEGTGGDDVIVADWSAVRAYRQDGSFTSFVPVCPT